MVEQSFHVLTSPHKYNLSSNCLTLTIGNVDVFDGGLYEVFVSTRAGEDSSIIAVTVTGGWFHFLDCTCTVV